MIKAKGVRNGKPMEVIYKDGEFTFNGKFNSALEMEMGFELLQCHPVGGTYYPQESDLLNIYNTMQNHFFDYNAEMETDEDIPQIEGEDGVVY